ncbi:hypothetical protein PybrP1_012848 [[Pythium] brassicae (nom. inval.)]|nr:hypothetical protein PybrP1_012848 [[Pythium] brassicae (nom. inval.)]
MAALELSQRAGTSACDEGESEHCEAAGESRAMALLTAVERSVLRALAFVFYQLDRTQAKSVAHAVLRWYFHLQAQLPTYAVASLERVAASVVALSDAQFTSFWLSLLEKEIDATDDSSVDSAPPFVDGGGSSSSSCVGTATPATPESRVTIHIDDASEREHEQARDGHDELLQEREKTLAKRLYLHIYGGIRSLFFAKRSHMTQTPCTSPVDLLDESHYQIQTHRYRRPFAGATRHLMADASVAGDDANWYGEDLSGSHHHEHDVAADAGCLAEREAFEPGWAVEYMEQESPVAAELTRRMRRMMHSSVPLNLFRVTVAFGSATRTAS